MHVLISYGLRQIRSLPLEQSSIINAFYLILGLSSVSMGRPGYKRLHSVMLDYDPLVFVIVKM